MVEKPDASKQSDVGAQSAMDEELDIDQRPGFWQRLRARHLMTDLMVIVITVVLAAVSGWLYFYASDDVVFDEFQLALFTSLLATIALSIIDAVKKYKNFENAEFIDNLYTFGIRNLYFDKFKILKRQTQAASGDIWVSGYRLILTKRIAADLHKARKRGAKIHMLLCPPWTVAHKLVYSDIDRSLDRYIDLFSMIVDNDSSDVEDVEIRFTDHPLFNDTYRFDDTIVTSPFMHAGDVTYGKMCAKDFFTYEVKEGTRLFKLLKEEYETLYENAEYKIELPELKAALSEIEANRLNATYEDKVKIFLDHLDPKPQLEAGGNVVEPSTVGIEPAVEQ